MTPKKRRELAVGDKIRFVGAISWNDEDPGSCYGDPRLATVKNEFDNGCLDVIVFVNGNNEQGRIHRRQVTHVIRKKPKKATAADERVERWLLVGPGASGYSYNERDNAELDRDVTQRIAHLTEIRPGERVLSRADLAKAWDGEVGKNGAPYLVFANHETSTYFKHLADALGLEKEK